LLFGRGDELLHYAGGALAPPDQRPIPPQPGLAQGAPDNAADALNGEGTIQLLCRNQGKAVRIEVEDNGPGLATAVRERLFEPFVTTKEVGKGTGLGLAVCRGLVESAGGIIGWDASFAEGTRFVIELPCFEAAAS